MRLFPFESSDLRKFGHRKLYAQVEFPSTNDFEVQYIIPILPYKHFWKQNHQQHSVQATKPKTKTADRDGPELCWVNIHHDLAINHDETYRLSPALVTHYRPRHIHKNHPNFCQVWGPSLDSSGPEGEGRNLPIRCVLVC